TPAGESVDADGCSSSQLDADDDGVSDLLDQCPNTPAGESVDADGCSSSQLDTDDDGVSDALDQCANTPAGETVDADGCSSTQLDTDGDGVSDTLDQCANTPAGETVDADGCSSSQLDADGDGFTADVDCNDNDLSINPGASEIKHDSVDQDCNGYDLSIDVTRARYIASKDKIIVWATSALGDQAALAVTIDLTDGGNLTKNLVWKATKNRWQRTLGKFVSRYGSVPVSVSVSGTEGAESAQVEQR
ncbi:MAG: hypothetical protein GY720_01530, partial [bacterium]|nr:hypothetical protein [bacterium]